MQGEEDTDPLAGTPPLRFLLLGVSQTEAADDCSAGRLVAGKPDAIATEIRRHRFYGEDS